MSEVPVINNPATTAASLARVTGDYRNNIEVPAVINTLNKDVTDLQNYNHQLQKHLKSEYYNLLDQNALMEFSKTENDRLSSKIQNLKQKSSYNDRIHLFNYSSNKRIQVYTKLLISVLVVILLSIGMFILKNKGVFSETITSVLIAVMVFVVFLYFFFELSDIKKRNKFNFDKYNFPVSDDMLKPMKMKKANNLNSLNVSPCGDSILSKLKTFTAMDGATLTETPQSTDNSSSTEPQPTNEGEGFSLYK